MIQGKLLNKQKNKLKKKFKMMTKINLFLMKNLTNKYHLNSKIKMINIVIIQEMIKKENQNSII